MDLFRLSISCSDGPGIVAAVTGVLNQHQANLLTLEQHSTDAPDTCFFMRIEFEMPAASYPEFEAEFAAKVAPRFDMHWHASVAGNLPRVSIMASKTDHCVLELLWRWQRGELPCEIVQVVSNHETLREAVEGFGVRFEHVPVSTDTKAEAEAKQQTLMADSDLIVLARYMQVLSPQMVAAWPQRIINIHHSFLPAFVGADPYQQAWDRGVKLIGATAHYVTDELDEGPIIQQAVGHVSHRDSVADLKHLGQELERKALYQAVRWHLEERVVVHGRRTVVFS